MLHGPVKAGMADIRIVVASIAALAATICLAFEDKAVLAMPLVIVFAELVRTLVRRMGRCRITPAAVRRRHMMTGRCESRAATRQLPRCIAASCTL